MNIVFISPIAWDNSGGAHRPVQFAQQLALRGHTVTYIEIEKSRTTAISENPRVLTLEDLGWDELNLVRAWYGFDYQSPASLTARLGEAFPALDEGGVVICSAPFRPAVEYLAPFAAAGYAIVYDTLDDISTMRALGTFCYDEMAENYLAEQSDLIITLSPRLRQKFARHKHTAFIRDGVDLQPFRTAAPFLPHDPELVPNLAEQIVRGELTLGFWGTMYDYNLDVPLLQTITRARPHWEFHFIGSYDLDPARPSLELKLHAPNVHFHTSVSRTTLAQCARSFDVCILPTPVTPFNLARDPLKVYEYLACYKPVVATNLEQLNEMPYVYLANDAQDFLGKVEAAARVPINAGELDVYLQEQTWVKRVDQLEGALGTLTQTARPLPTPPRGAMPGAETELDRSQAFAAHLERLVLDREAHIRELEEALAQSSIAQKVKRALGRP